MFPKKGNFLPEGPGRGTGDPSYAAIVASALRKELGDSHRATKTVMRWTGASERTAKNWLAGHHGPGGDYLIILMEKSDTVFEAILTVSGRRAVVVAARMLAARGALREVATMIERNECGDLFVGLPAVARREDRFDAGPDVRNLDRINDRDESPPDDRLNMRQRWVLEALANQAVGIGDVQRRWGVSEKTARRDIAVLKNLGMIEFVGPARMGRYRLVR